MPSSPSDCSCSVDSPVAIIIGAGPAGLTAALELLRRTNIKPIILESSDEIGGISRTIHYKGNRMDIGGHRFFSKSDRVMRWWSELIPTQADGECRISYEGKSRMVKGDCPSADGDLVMLVRPRKSRIYYLRSFFEYPISLSKNTLAKLGLMRTMRIGASYIRARVSPITPEKNLEDFLINRFGRQLYLTFFKSYTEKVWGTACRSISREWGAQRIKGLSLVAALRHFLKKAVSFKRKKDGDVAQKETDTSLIERFLYPKLGPGQLWEHVAELIVQQGGEIHKGWTVDKLNIQNQKVVSVQALHSSGERKTFAGCQFFSTMPMRDLVRSMQTEVPAKVRSISEGLQYRDFITVGLLVDRLHLTEPDGSPLKDTWIYIQEPDVLLGRLQIFNNWSSHLVSDPTKMWIGLEYFCYEGDDLWTMTDEALKQFAIGELAKIGIIAAEHVQDAHVVRVPKTYPAYFGAYENFDELRAFTDSFDNLFLIGRNGMHRYNNQDHSMLTAMAVVDGLVAGHVNKADIWTINTEQEYHETKEKAA